MKLFGFPVFAVEKAVAKRMLTLETPHKEWFSQRWAQKPYRKAFVENKAMPLVTMLAKGKSWDEATFNEELSAWDALLYPAEMEVLRPMIEGDGLLQLMQKNVPAERIQALLNKLETQRQA
ncbi:MAG: hypothetical protein U1D25_16585 [Hydrogenophaga sp.]|uniref:hypothetical protein n=1 Tax=Hydrogenophaga sp. TaxID=1904254 RepID=UPI0027799FA6|nr:hypothetical protein [Hydrogenophaga sp.]MDP2417288.1 hypothetical protein [Hydrogenophaga sp.]MDZ4189702.1 hypothetical protein [Hydrogenophaga sp.]